VAASPGSNDRAARRAAAMVRCDCPNLRDSHLIDEFGLRSANLLREPGRTDRALRTGLETIDEFGFVLPSRCSFPFKLSFTIHTSESRSTA